MGNNLVGDFGANDLDAEPTLAGWLFLGTLGLIPKDLIQLCDQFQQSPFSALGEQGELDSDTWAKMPLADEALDADRQLPDAEGHLHGFAFSKARVVAEPHQAAFQTQIDDRSQPSQSGRETANLRLPSALKPAMLPSIPFALRHAAPLRSSDLRGTSAGRRKCMRNGTGLPVPRGLFALLFLAGKFLDMHFALTSEVDHLFTGQKGPVGDDACRC